MIGQIRTNKAETPLGLFDIIHSVDTLHLAETLSRRAPGPAPYSLEVNVTGEPSRYDFAPSELDRATLGKRRQS
jgi:uncharacterized pyridoxal phosphate-containing UPF0001 family protein